MAGTERYSQSISLDIALVFSETIHGVALWDLIWLHLHNNCRTCPGKEIPPEIHIQNQRMNTDVLEDGLSSRLLPAYPKRRFVEDLGI